MSDNIRSLLGWAAIIGIETIALLIGGLLYHYGTIAWYAVPLFALIPPAFAVFLLVAGLTRSMRNGGNPFQ